MCGVTKKADEYTGYAATYENDWNNNSNEIHKILKYLEIYRLIIGLGPHSKTTIAITEKGVKHVGNHVKFM
jgi:hypothetical protein